MNDIKNIIFDLGGVILHLDYSNTTKEFNKLGLFNFEKLYSQKNKHKFLMILKRVKFLLKNLFFQ